MAKTIKSRRNTRNEQSFHEFLPGATMSTYDIFPVRRDAYYDEDYAREANDPDAEVRSRMVRQLLILVGLLIIQFILFVILIRSTLSLA